MTTRYQVRTLLDLVGSRSRAMLATAPRSANWKLAVSQLDQALRQAQVIIRNGRGQAPGDLWRAFINAITNASILLSTEKKKAAGAIDWNTANRQEARLIRDLGLRGLGDDGEMVFTTEEAEASERAMPAAEKAAQSAYTAEFIASEREKIARGEIPSSPALVPQSFWEMLNPPATPLYSRPIFLFAAAGASMAVYYLGSKYMERQEAPALPERRYA